MSKEIVRCKDCKWYRVRALTCVHPHFNGLIGVDGFCSYGESKKLLINQDKSNNFEGKSNNLPSTLTNEEKVSEKEKQVEEVTYYEAGYMGQVVATIYADNCILTDKQWEFFLGKNLVASLDRKLINRVFFYKKGGTNDE